MDAAAPRHRSSRRRMTVIAPTHVSWSSVWGELVKLGQYRDLLYTLSVHRIKVRYKQSALGVLWALLQPLSLMLMYTLIFSVVAKMPSDGEPYMVFAYAALLPWTCFATAVTNATNSLVSHSTLVTKVYFPREILPFTYVVAALFDFCVASSVFMALLVYYDIPFTLNMLYAIPLMGILTCLSTAMSLCLSATQVRFRDVGVAVPLMLQLWMFATPVVYPLTAVPQRLQSVYQLNPLVGIIESFRQVTLKGMPPDTGLLIQSAVVSAVLLGAAYVYFKHVEATLADVI